MSRGQPKRVTAGMVHEQLLTWNRDKISQDFFAKFGQKMVSPTLSCSPCDAIAPDLVTVQFGYEFEGGVDPNTLIPNAMTVNTDLSGLVIEAQWNTGLEVQTARIDLLRSGHVCFAAWNFSLYITYPPFPGPGAEPPGARPPILVQTSVSLRSKSGGVGPQCTLQFGALVPGGQSGQLRIPQWANTVIVSNDNVAAATMQVNFRPGVGGAQAVQSALVGKDVPFRFPQGSEIVDLINPAANPGLSRSALIFGLDLS